LIGLLPMLVYSGALLTSWRRRARDASFTPYLPGVGLMG
jgi:hypothetical protein